jgi:hypothetical protein
MVFVSIIIRTGNSICDVIVAPVSFFDGDGEPPHIAAHLPACAVSWSPGEAK